MTQLILNGVELPETTHDKYKSYPTELSVQVDMISGRQTREVRGRVQMIEYSYDYMGIGDSLMRRLLAVLRSGQPITARYLSDESDESIEGEFWCTALTPPTYAFSRDGRGYWHNIAFTLREVKPHD